MATRSAELSITTLLLSHPRWYEYSYEDFLLTAVKAAYDGTLRPSAERVTQQDVRDAAAHLNERLSTVLEEPAEQDSTTAAPQQEPTSCG